MHTRESRNYTVTTFATFAQIVCDTIWTKFVANEPRLTKL